MAKYQSGIHGPFSGKVGTVVGASWKGIPYMRSIPKKRTGKVSDAEQANRKRFAIAQAWLKPLTPFLRVGFKSYRERLEGFVAAKSYLLKNAIEQDEGLFWINPEKALVSYGQLEVPSDVETVFDEDNLQFQWKASGLNASNARDQIMLMTYCLEEKQAVYETHGAFRETGTAILALPANFKGKSILVYVAFVSADRESQSMSLFVGEMLVPVK
ncbi:MAG TPA: DUF6266 family protein [Pelobium sp.]|nr:DUF6266 family protein [Pelobium sp.]